MQSSGKNDVHPPLSVRKACEADFERIMAIYRYAQEYMIRNGNPTQWGHFYPTGDLIREDIQLGRCLVICGKTEIHGVFALFEGAEPTYEYIEDGHWLNDEPYVTIHRIAGDGQVHGLLKCAVDYCRGLSGNIRIDTHADNKTMQHLIEQNGFIRCGIIYVEDGSPRFAYQRIMS
ncbi:MAG: N-acetyltransferase [Firmicutes bacterium]|nr:N-acetyltransferase [Bacillota bacterium]